MHSGGTGARATNRQSRGLTPVGRKILPPPCPAPPRPGGAATVTGTRRVGKRSIGSSSAELARRRHRLPPPPHTPLLLQRRRSGQGRTAAQRRRHGTGDGAKPAPPRPGNSAGPALGRLCRCAGCGPCRCAGSRADRAHTVRGGGGVCPYFRAQTPDSGPSVGWEAPAPVCPRAQFCVIYPLPAAQHNAAGRRSRRAGRAQLLFNDQNVRFGGVATRSPCGAPRANRARCTPRNSHGVRPHITQCRRRKSASVPCTPRGA